jgi:hypothetical protein
VQRRIAQRNGRTASESEALEAIPEHAFETWGSDRTALARYRPVDVLVSSSAFGS